MYTTFEQAHGLTKWYIGAVTKSESYSADFRSFRRKNKRFPKELPTLLFVGGSAGTRGL